MSDIENRVDRLESLVEQQQETIENQQETIQEQRGRIAELEADDTDAEGEANTEPTPPVSRRDALTAGGLLALLFGGVGAASADPQGQVGTSSDPLNALYTETLYGSNGTVAVQDDLDIGGNKLTNAASINGGVTGNTEITDLVGSGLTINSNTLEATGSSLWTDSGDDGLLNPADSGDDGIGVTNVQTDNLTDNGSGDVTMGNSLDLGGNNVRLTEDYELDMQPGLDAVEFRDTNNGHTTFRTITGDPGAVDLLNANLRIRNGYGITDGFGERHLSINGTGPLGVNKTLDLNGNDLTNAASINGGVTGNTEITDLIGSGLTINSGSLEAAAAKWEEADSDGLLETAGAETGIDVTDIRIKNVRDASGNTHLTVNDGGPLALNQTLNVNTNDLTNVASIDGGGSPIRVDDNLDANGNKLTDNSGDLNIEGSSGNGVTINTDGGNSVLELGVPTSDGSNTAGGNVVAGHPNNAVNNGAVGAIIGGGGNDGTNNENTVEDDYGTVGGGEGNQAGSTGSDETNARWATVGGGNANTASAVGATVSGGDSNTASGDDATVGGGDRNTASGNQATAAGGNANTAAGHIATVAGGNVNTASGSNATVGGGVDNTASGNDSTVPGGESNTASGTQSFAAGREADTNEKNGAFVWGDSSSTAVTATAADSARFQVPGGFAIQDGNLDVESGTVRNSTGSLSLSTESGDLSLQPSDTVNLNANRISNAKEIHSDSSYITFKGSADLNLDGSELTERSGDLSLTSVNSVNVDIDTDDNDTVGNREFNVTKDGGATTLFTVNDGGEVDILQGDLDMNGGTVVNESDARLKTAIEPIENPAEKLAELEPRTYAWKDDEAADGREAGVLAQSVEDVLPEAVKEDEDGFLKLAYRQLTPLVISAVHEQQDAIDDLEAENEQLRERVAAIEAELGIDATADQQVVADD